MRCERCGGPITSKQAKRFCTVRCANQRHKHPDKACPVCHRMFHPGHRGQQVTCSRSCAGLHANRHTQRVKALAKARAAGAQAYAKRLGDRLKTMSRGAIWREAYLRGYNAARQRLHRGMAA